ncbi:tetratricopeptide repeat protein [Catenulispora subtropica]|uniref:tetratricopeptide repeat protein n=1 Tax=Catenulispora subtropica TaxID=450798 RepID=UPI0031D91D13
MRGRGRGTDPQWITQEFARAEDLAAAGQMERARDRYARLARRLSTAPEDVRHYRGLALLGEAETILAMGIFTDAMARFREAYPLLTEPFRQLPRWLVRQFAEERLRVEDGDLRPVIDFLQALAYGVEAGDEETAVRTIVWLQERCLTGPNAQREATARAALAALPGVDWPVLALTTMLRRDGRVKEAEDLLAAWVPGGSGELWFRWGIQLSTLRRYDQAISAYDEAERRGTGPASPWSRGPWLRPEAMLFRGLAHQQMGRTEQAERDLRAAADVAPQDPRVHYSLGRLSVQLGADYQAWSHFSTALAVESAFAPARLGLALLREQSGRPAEAIAHYQAALRHDNTSRAARIRLGAVLLAAGRRDEAEELLHPEAEESSYWGGMASFHYGLAQLRASNPAGALETWEKLRTGELREWIAVARDREARRLLDSDPTAARIQLQLALLDAPEATERRAALREAALREAAWLLLAGRELPENREKAAAALDLAASLPVEARVDTHRTRQNRLRALVDLAGGTTANLPDFLDPAGPVRDRCHLAVAALVEGRVDQAVALLAGLPADPGCDPEIARVRALVAERTGEWAEAVLWYRRFLDNDVAPVAGAESAASEDADSERGGAGEDDAESTLTLDVNEIALAGERAAAKKAAEAAVAEAPGPLCATAVGVECTREAAATCAGCGREGCDAHLFRPTETHSHRCERCVESALHAVLYAARRAGIPTEAERILTKWATALHGTGLTPRLRRQLAMLRAEAGDLDGALERLPADAEAERVDLLIRRAAEAIRRGEPYLALGDLRQALQVRPDQPQALAALEALAEYEARQHAEEQRNQEAFDGYLRLVRDAPTNPRLLHALGLAAYRIARTTGSAEHWMWTIGCLVSALYAPDFRPQATGATPEALAPGQERFVADRGSLMEELRDTLRAVDEANGRTGEEADAWTVRLGMDVFACETNPILSPTLDRLLREQPETPALLEWRDLADTLRAAELAEMAEAEASGDEEAERNRTVALYGELGPQHYLYEDGRFKAAIAALDTVAEEDRGEEWTVLLRKTLVMRGMELHLDEQWADALDCIARAASLTPDTAPESMLVEIAAESGLNAARVVLGRPVRGGDAAGAGGSAAGGRSGDGGGPDSEARTVELGAAARTVDLAKTTEIAVPAPDDWQAVIAVLEKALTVAPDDADLLADLAVAHTRKSAELRVVQKDYVLALAHVRRALDLTPDDPEAFALLEVVLAERAGSLTRPGPDGDLLEAVQWWQELSEIDPKPEYQAGLSRALGLLACSAAVAGRRPLALDRMAWSLLADPQWSGDADAAAPHQIAHQLIAQAMDEEHPKPFHERATRLRTALAYRDTPELRALMIALWKNEATFQYETRHYGLCAALLEEAVQLEEDPNATLNLTRTPNADPDGMQPFHWHLYPKARSLIKRTVDHFPDDDELRELHARSTRNDDPASP